MGPILQLFQTSSWILIYPYDPPKPETFTEKPKLIPYQQSDINYRHYGKIVEQFMAATTSMDDENPAQKH